MEQDNSDKIIMYCMIVVIVIVAACAIIGISMIDFSGANKQKIATSNISSTNKVGLNNAQKNSQNANLENEKNNIIENNDLKVEEDNNVDNSEQIENDSKSIEEIESEINSIIENQDMVEGRKKAFVSDDRVIVETDDENLYFYFKFNESNKATGFYIEGNFDTVEEAKGYITLFQRMSLSGYEIIDNNKIVTQCPMPHGLYNSSKEEIVESLSTQYFIEYQN